MLLTKVLCAMGQTFKFRHLKSKNLQDALRLYEPLGWGLSHDDVDCYLQGARKGFWGVLGEDDTLIGSVLTTPQDERTVFVGLLAIAERYRKMGMGSFLIEKVLKDFSGYNIHFEAVPHLAKMYESLGFVGTGRAVYQGSRRVHSIKGYSQCVDLNIQEVSNDRIRDIMAYDYSISSVDRSNYVPVYLLAKSANLFGAFEGGECVGYAGVRKLDGGRYNIQPLYSDSQRIAEALMQHMITSGAISEGACAYVMPHSENTRSIDVFKQFGFEEGTKIYTSRFRLGQDIVQPWHKVYSVCNVENTVI